jgi:hypothetical protein
MSQTYSIKEHNRHCNITRYMLHPLVPGGGYTTSKSFGHAGPVRGCVRSISAIIKPFTCVSCWFPFLVLRAPITRLNCPVIGQSFHGFTHIPHLSPKFSSFNMSLSPHPSRLSHMYLYLCVKNCIDLQSPYTVLRVVVTG